MPYLRQRPKIPATGRVSIKLTISQRDQLSGRPALPRALAHLLHRAPVAQGKLRVRLTRSELDALILAAAAVPTLNPEVTRALDVFLDYLEAQANRFESADPEDTPPTPDA